MQCEFIFHVYIIAWTDDIPALSKVMNITGYNSYLGCRFCDIKGIYSEKHKHIYFPTDLKKIYTKKNNSTWLTRINKIIYLILGIKEKSILFELQSIKFSRYFPIDIMHLFFENVVLHIFKL